MRKNHEDVILAFLNGKAAKSPKSGKGGFSGGGQVALISEVTPADVLGVRTESTSLVSYNTVIAVRCEGCCHGKAILMNGTEYSMTSNNQQRSLKRMAASYHVPLIEVARSFERNISAGSLHRYWLALSAFDRAALMRQAELHGFAAASPSVERSIANVLTGLEAWRRQSGVEYDPSASIIELSKQLFGTATPLWGAESFHEA